MPCTSARLCGANLRNRLPNHEQIDAAVKLGATHVFAHVGENAAARAAEEKDLIAGLHPPLNTQHRTPFPGNGLFPGLSF